MPLPILVMLCAAPAPAAPATHLRHPAPGFVLQDADGKNRPLASFRGRPVALFFFCGCQPCHACARLWTQAQQSGAFVQPGGAPITVVVYSGEAGDARAFRAQTGLVPQTVLLPDPQDRVTSLYGVTVCPRVFVLDPQGRLRYTNDEPGADPAQVPAATLVSRIVTTLGQNAAPRSAPPAEAKGRKRGSGHAK